jgi:tripartite-type tricarboxylate transporter receptor subunit TctC
VKHAVLFSSLVAGAMLGATPHAAAQSSWPDRPIRLVVPFPPGGQTDTYTRLIARKLQEQAGGTVLVENRPGADTRIASDFVAKAAPDGTTYLVNGAVIAINASLFPKLPYDTLKDFAPVSLLFQNPLILAAAPTLAVTTVADVVKHSQSQPRGVNFASAGKGTMGHLALEMFDDMAKLRVEHIAYKGSAPALQDLITGTVALFFDNTTSVLPFIRAGRAKAIAITSPKRVANLPDLPTMQEGGIAGFTAINWTMLLAPAATPAPLLARMEAETIKAMRSKEIGDQLANDAVEVAGSDRAEAARMLRDEIARWGKVIKERNIQPN